MTLEGDAIDALIRRMAPTSMGLLLPPPCLLDMQGEFIAYEEGQRLSLRFPVLERYRNPMGNMQGGLIAAAFDNVLGPLSYLVAPPSVTTSLNVQYLRPVVPGTPHLLCEARVVARTRNVLHLAADARTPDGKVVAMCQAVQQLVPMPATPTAA